MAFWAAFLWIMDYFFQILKNSNIFHLFFLKIKQFWHVYYTKFIRKFSLYTNFEISQKFSVKSQIFLHILIVPIMYKWEKVKKFLSNKIGIFIYFWTLWAAYRCDSGYRKEKVIDVNAFKLKVLHFIWFKVSIPIPQNRIWSE